MDPVSLRHWLAGCWVGGGGGGNIAVVAYKGVLQTMHQGICMDLISTDYGGKLLKVAATPVKMGNNLKTKII